MESEMLQTRPIQIGETLVSSTTFDESCCNCPANSGTEVVNGERRILHCALQMALLDGHVRSASNLLDNVEAALGKDPGCLPAHGGKNARDISRLLDNNYLEDL